jgi:hypothetical protein
VGEQSLIKTRGFLFPLAELKTEKEKKNGFMVFVTKSPPPFYPKQ